MLFCLEKNAKKGYKHNTSLCFSPIYLWLSGIPQTCDTHTCHHKLFKYILQGFKNIHCNIWITLCLKVINSLFCWQKSQDPAFHNQLLGASAAWVPAEHVTCFKCWGRPYMSVINYLRCSYFIVWFIHSQFLTKLSPSCPADNQSLGLF